MPSDGQDDLVFIKTTSGKTCIFFKTNFIFIRKFVCFSGKTNISQSFFPPKNRSSCVFTILSDSKASERALAWRSALELLRRSVGIEALNTQLVETFWVLQSYPPGNELTISHQTGFQPGKSSGRKCRRWQGICGDRSQQKAFTEFGVSIDPSIHPSIIRCTCIYFRIFLANYLSTYFVSSHLSYPGLAYPMYARKNPSLPKQ